MIEFNWMSIWEIQDLENYFLGGHRSIITLSGSGFFAMLWGSIFTQFFLHLSTILSRVNSLLSIIIIIVGYFYNSKPMLPSITHDFISKSMYTTQNKLRYKRSSEPQSNTQFNLKAMTHTTFQTSKPVSLIRYSKVESRMFESNTAQEIKEIDKKIRECEKRIQKEKAKSQIQRETQFIKKSAIGNFTGFDFLTNPKMGQEEEEEEEGEEEGEVEVEKIVVEVKGEIKLQGQEFIKQKNQYLDKHYSHDLKKKFERRSMMPHMACKRKVPKLHITKNNKIQKNGKVESESQHLFRILSKEATPIEIYPTIPNFATVKDTVSKNISAYLTDYKPFIQKVAKVSSEAVA